MGQRSNRDCGSRLRTAFALLFVGGASWFNSASRNGHRLNVDRAKRTRRSAPCRSN